MEQVKTITMAESHKNMLVWLELKSNEIITEMTAETADSYHANLLNLFEFELNQFESNSDVKELKQKMIIKFDNKREQLFKQKIVDKQNFGGNYKQAQIRRLVSYGTGIELTREAMEIIEANYTEVFIENKYDITLFRLISAAQFLTLFISYWIAFEFNFFALILMSFTVYNLLHFFRNFIDYRDLKKH